MGVSPERLLPDVVPHFNVRSQLVEKRRGKATYSDHDSR